MNKFSLEKEYHDERNMLSCLLQFRSKRKISASCSTDQFKGRSFRPPLTSKFSNNFAAIHDQIITVALEAGCNMEGNSNLEYVHEARNFDFLEDGLAFFFT